MIFFFFLLTMERILSWCTADKIRLSESGTTFNLFLCYVLPCAATETPIEVHYLVNSVSSSLCMMLACGLL